MHLTRAGSRMPSNPGVGRHSRPSILHYLLCTTPLFSAVRSLVCGGCGGCGSCGAARGEPVQLGVLRCVIRLVCCRGGGGGCRRTLVGGGSRSGGSRAVASGGCRGRCRAGGIASTSRGRCSRGGSV